MRGGLQVRNTRPHALHAWPCLAPQAPQGLTPVWRGALLRKQLSGQLGHRNDRVEGRERQLRQPGTQEACSAGAEGGHVQQGGRRGSAARQNLALATSTMCTPLQGET